MKVGKRLLSWLLTIAMIAGVLQTNTVTAYASSKDDPEQLTITSAEVTTADGSALTNGTALKYGDKIYLTLSWTIPNKDQTTGAHHTTGDYFKAEIDGVQFDTVVKNVPATDTTTYPNPVAEAEVVSQTEGTGSDFYLHYTDEDFLGNEDEIKGQLTIEATLSKDRVKVNDDGTCSWTFPGGITYTGTITRDTSNDGLKIEKSFDDNYSSLKERVATIKVTSVGENKNVKVEDSMDANLELVSGSIKVGEESKDSFPIDLGSMSDGETKTITYKVNVKSAALGNANEHNQWNSLSNASNTATASADGVSSVSATADVRVNHKWVDKSYEDNGDTITWTVTINPSDAKANLNGATIKDTLSTNQKDVTDFSSTKDGITKDNFFDGGYTFSEDDYQSYTVTYTTTKDKSGAGKKVYSNSVAFTPKDGSTFTVTSSLPGEGSDPGVSKSYQIEDETQPDIITYTAVVTIPAGYGEIENATFTDAFNPAWGSSMALVEDGEVKMNDEVISDKDGFNKTEKGFTYTWDIPESSSEQRFTFTYKAQITDGIAGYWYGNSASIGVGDNKWSGSTSYQYQPYEEPATAPEASKSVNGNNTNSTGLVEWKVQMADASMITSTNQELVLVDTLPEGLEYVANSAQLVGYNENGWLKEDPIALTPAKGTDEDGNTTLSFTIPTSAVAYYVRQEKGPQWNSPVITYQTKVSGNVAEMTEQQTYTNKAQWQLDGDLGKAGEATYTFQPGSDMQLVDKTKGAINGSSVTYTIKVNENALQINGGNAYTLTDTSGSGIDIDVSTVKISGDRASHAVSYTDHVLTIADLADSTSYTITYTASIEHRTVAEFSSKIEDFANKVNLTGISVGKTESGAAITLSEYRDIAWTMGVNEQIKFRKTDAETHEGLQGAVFTLYRLTVTKTTGSNVPTVGDTGEQMGTYTTDADGYIKIGYTKTGNDTLLHDTVYVLKETTAPTGYTKSDDAIYFVFAGSDGYDWTGYKTASGKNLLINESGYTPGAVEVTNSKDGEEPEKTTTTVKISKVAVGGTGELAGAQLKVTQNGKLIEQWESGDTAHTFELEDGTYVLTEITAPNGYEKAEAITFTVATTTEEDGAKTVSVTSETEGAVTGDATDGFTVTMKDAYEEYDVTISKTDITGSQEIGGAALKITKGSDGTGDEVASWTSVAGQSKVVQLAAGTYTLTETTAPTGYTQAESITFVVTEDGKVQVGGTDVSSVVMKDDYAAHEVTVSKVDVADVTKELAGATLTIYDADGNIAKDQNSTNEDGSFKDATWVSTSEVHKVKLAAGTYTLVEETAPDGYTKAESIEFTIGLDGKVTSTAYLNGQLVMRDTAVDNQKEVKISKADLNGKEIKGATLIVTNNADGSVVDRFETDGITTHSIYVEAGTYTLTEKTVPNGYEKSEDVVFTVDADGKVSITGSTGAAADEDSDGIYTVTMTDNWKTSKVRISKQDMAGNELKGAKLTVTHQDGENTVTDDTWTSDGTTHVIEGLTPGTYTLTEKSAPKGYEVAESITFTIAADGTITTTADTDAETGAIIMQDAYKAYDVKISKVDATNSEEIAGATLTITGKTTSGETIKTITIYTDGVTLNAVKLQPGDYTLTETAAPDGYQIASSIDFTVGTDGKVNKANDAGILVMEDAPEAPSTYPVAISKQDIAGKEIKGATLSIQQRVDGKMTTVESFETDGVNVHTVYLAAGTYRLKETITPNGYETASIINFTVNEDGSVTSENLVNGELVMTDNWSNQTVTISKRDICGEEIAGAKLKITDLEGKVVKDQTKVEGSEELNNASWTSEAGKSHEVQLQPGTYILVEETAPNGYVQAESITFTLAADGSITANGGSVENGTLVMTDKYTDTEVQISKYAVGGSAEIAGATLKITGKTLDGKEIAPISFGTDGTEHKFQLQPGSYTLTEITAPDGYEKAESIDFTVEIGGKVKVGTDEMTGNKVTMYDKQSTAKWPVSISKMDITGANEIKGATLKITGTNVDTETVNIEFTTDGVLEHEIYLKQGSYTLTEETAPQGYQKAEQITFEVTADGKVTNVAGGEYKAGSIVMTDKWRYQSVTISKVDIAGAEVVGAELKVTGQDAAGNKISPKTWTSTGKVQRISLLPGEYTLTETLAPDGYEKSSSIDFTVGTDGKVKVGNKETDKVVMTDKWEDTRVSFSKADVNGKEIAGAVLAVTGTTKNGTTIDKIEFQSDGVNVHTFSLQPGTYTLTETTVPNGYVKAESIQFTVEVGGTIKIGEDEVSKVVMTDKAADKTIKISKEDIAGSGEVAGATLAVIDTTNSKTVDSWVSDGQTAHEVTYAFTAGQNYILKEITAPDGYDQLSSSIQFQVTNAGKVIVMSDDKIDGKEVAMVADDGTLVINNKKTVVEEPQTEENNGGGNGGNDGGDEGGTGNGGGGSTTPKVPSTTPKTEEPKVPNTQTVIIVRTDEETGEGLEGGVFELYNEDGELVGTYTTNEYGIIQVDGLEPGNYYFIEIKAPEGYEALGWDKVFTVTEDGAAEVLAVSTGRISANPDYTGSQIGEGAVSATGDDSLMTIYGSAAAMAAAVLVLWVVARRKRQHI